MNMPLTGRSIGLDGIPAAVTALSLVDGENGVLVIAGLSVERLAETLTFEAVAAGLWRIADPRAEAVEPATFGRLRAAAFEQALHICPSLVRLGPVDGLRAALAALDIADGPSAAAAIVAAVPVLIATLEALRAGRAPLAPDPALGHAADMLRMLRGAPPSPAEARALDAYLTTVSDHGMNASTFACRVVTATRASLVSAVTAAYGALSGPLHGGAPGPVLDMLDAIATRENIAPWIDAALARGERLMGFGHRIYKVRDPRAEPLMKNVLAMVEASGERQWFDIAQKLEKLAMEDEYFRSRNLSANVDFYSAPLLYSIGIPVDAFTCMFAMSRIVGWTAHVYEQHSNNRLIRPLSNWMGEHQLPWVAMEQRG